jgi:hypothetical protein
LNGKEGEASVSFTWPPKCLAKRELEFAVIESEGVNRGQDFGLQLEGETQNVPRLKGNQGV